MESAASLASGPDGRKRRVSYFYEAEIGDGRYGEGSLWEPKRICMLHNLILSCQFDRHMEIIRPNLAGVSYFVQFHSPEYVEFLASITPEYVNFLAAENSETIPDPSLKRFNLDVDAECPVFHGVFDYCRVSAGGSISAAAKLNRREADIAINWAGGMHRARRDKACRFCYINDIVLGILELLKVFKRVLYIDIGFHHGDAVQQAFYDTDRVMTVSFHKMDYHPSTGDIRDVGVGKGKYYSLNAPLKDGLDDASFSSLFRPVIRKAMEVYQPEAVVLQCGADSLGGDPYGVFNLSVMGHGDCLQFIRSFNVPLMVLGGGGYNIPNVVRCWCYETAIAVEVELEDNLPANECMEYFEQENKLHIQPNHMTNFNTQRDIAEIRITLLKQLSQIKRLPSVQFQDTPSTSQVREAAEEDMETRQNPHI